MNKTQTIEERISDFSLCEFEIFNPFAMESSYDEKKIIKYFKNILQSELKANDDAWRERIKELIEKNKAYDFGIYDYEGIALDLINLLKEKK